MCNKNLTHLFSRSGYHLSMKGFFRLRLGRGRTRLLNAANRLLFFDTLQFALGNKPAFAANIGQNFTLHHFFLEATDQLLW